MEKIDSVNEEEVLHLTTTDELESFPGLVRQQTVKHRSHKGGLLAYYDFDISVPCSYRDHRHNKGLVARALCGAVVGLGMHCGAATIEGFEDLRAQHRAARDFRDYQAVAQDLCGSLPGLLDRVDREVLPLLRFRSALLNDTVMGKVGTEMKKRWASPGMVLERSRILVNNRGLLDPQGDNVRSTIAGLDLFDPTQKMSAVDARARSEVEAARKEVKGWREAKPTRRRAKQLREQLGKIEAAAKQLLQWGERARPFLRADNLREVLFSVGMENKADVYDGALRMRRANGTVILDLQGERFEADSEPTTGLDDFAPLRQPAP